MAYAEVTDVTVRWARTPTAEETALITTRLEDVERMISRRVDIGAALGLGTFLEEDIIQIEADAVLRLIRNPEGYLSETDGDYTYMLRQDLASGRLEILAEDWEVLGWYTPKAFTLVPRLVLPT